ncbi:MAG TPA: glutamate-cysteine ligase family protein [Fibrobacteraceae bacterium]|nr:glutamate-cysteine ligase family protein [Fibrobacteraceae bacterium]
MAEVHNHWSLWDRYGVEQEYMLVNATSLDVEPKADLLLCDVMGEEIENLEHDGIGYSNELVAHVLELKAAQPLTTLHGWSSRIAQEIRTINDTLRKEGLRLLPTAAHPWMDPLRETVLWAHGDDSIYRTYDRIFGCQGHGWSNLQSTHLNLSFQGDDQFAALHAAVRAVLPLIPALSAASPYLGGAFCGSLDGRLEVYRHNQDRIPIITGAVIPEAVFSEAQYEREIFYPIGEAIAPFDPEGLLNKYFLNSRGAIARFDRGALEIRIIDLQECPDADLVILQMVSGLLQCLCEERWVSLQQLQALKTESLAQTFLDAIRSAEETSIQNSSLLEVFGFARVPIRAGEFWQKLWPTLNAYVEPALHPIAELLLQRGSLANALLRLAGVAPSHSRLHTIYSALANSLEGNRPWDGRSC